MIEFVLTRMFFNDWGIFGELKEMTSGFRCATFERCPPKESDNAFQRSRKAMFCGLYEIGNEYLPLENRNTFKVMRLGKYNKAVFQLNKIQNVGDIVLARSFDWFGHPSDSKTVINVLDRFIMEKMAMGELPTKAKRGYAELLITESPEFCKRKSNAPLSKESSDDGIDWDMIDKDFLE
ncbi:MAG: hypothetical protein IJP75_09800 [Bacteroidaceae bacterium]|nr:hypothetical protein [Bacteroidaceae bacterium]